MPPPAEARTGPRPPAQSWEARGAHLWNSRTSAWLALAGALCIASTWILLQATESRSIEGAILWSGLGSITGGLGLIVCGQKLSEWASADHSGDRSHLSRKLGRGVGLVGLALIVVAALATSALLAAVGFTLLILALLPFATADTSATSAVAGSDEQSALGVTRAGVGLLLVSVLAEALRHEASAGAISAGLILLTALCWLGGLSAVKVGIGPWMDTETIPKRRSGTTFWVGLGLAVVGIALIFVGTSREWGSTSFAGATIVVTGLSVSGIATTRLRLDARRSMVVGGIGFAMIAFSFVGVFAAIQSPGLTLAACASVAALGAWFVFRGEAFVVLALLGFAVTWALVDRDIAGTGTLDLSQQSLVVLGDSFASGEGAERFFADSNQPNSNQCRRSPDAYGHQLAAELDLALGFYACSGASTRHLISEGQMPNSPVAVAGGEPQLEPLARIWPDDAASRYSVGPPAAIVVSVGGNDVGFADIVATCLLPGDCAALRLIWLMQAEAIEERLAATYQAIAAASPDTPILVVPYPRLLAADQIAAECDIPILAAEFAFVVEFTEALNASITSAAATAGVHVATDATEAFAGRGLCDDDPAVNFLDVTPTSGSAIDRLSPSNWFHGSMHPNEAGHRLLADTMSEQLAMIIEDHANGGRANPTPTSFEATENTQSPDTETPVLDEAVLDETALDDTFEIPDDRRQAWVSDVLYSTATAVAVPVLLLLGGGWMVAYAIINQPGPLRRLLGPAKANNR